MSELQLSKLDVAKRQVECAIHIYFNFGDAISIHTLSAAARNILANLCNHKDLSHPIQIESMLNELVDPIHHKEFINKLREPENFFKHADKDPDRLLKFNPEFSELWLLQCIEMYSLITSEHPPVMRAYRGWWVMHHQELMLKPPPPFDNPSIGRPYAKHERIVYYSDIMSAFARTG